MIVNPALRKESWMAGCVSKFWVDHSWVSLVPKRKEDTPCFQICSPGSISDEGPDDGLIDDEHAMQATTMIA